MTLIKLKVSSGEAKSGPYLAPILGQHQINLMEFCKFFNAESLKDYQQGVPLRVKIIKQQGFPLDIKIKGITLYSLFINFADKNSITIQKLYDLYKLLTKSGNNLYKKNIAYSMFGSFTSFKKFKIIF